MRVFAPAFALLVCLQASAQSRVDPRVVSVHPFTGQRGTTFTVQARGIGLAEPASAMVGGAPFKIAVEGVSQEPPTGRSKTPTDLVNLRVEIAGDAKPGPYPIRLVTRNGISNAVSLHIVEFPVASEPDGGHDTPESAVPVAAVPSVFAGRLNSRGEADFYTFETAAGETLSFEVVSGLPQIASGGSAATIANFDPSITIYSAEGSWFDSKRLKRIAYNDEPVWVFGLSTDAQLAHRFTQAGKYLLRVEAFAGQGGPDYSYHLKIARGALPEEAKKPGSGWDERTWTRRLDTNRLNQLSTRGGKSADQKSVETYRAAPEPILFKLPGTVEGTLLNPGETHRAKFHLEGPADIAMEVETPAAAPPFVNPIVRLLNSSGEEVATNIFVGRGACSGALTKSMQSKTVVPLRDPGDYTIEIRDATADLAGPEFQYRVQVRPQVAHVGQVRIDVDHLNFVPGEAKTVRVTFDREEDYRGAVTIVAEQLPPGISAAVGADYEPDKDPPLTTGKRERYTPRTERAVVVLSAGEDAAPTAQPHNIRLVARPLVDGKLGEILATKSFPVMVTAKQKDKEKP